MVEKNLINPDLLHKCLELFCDRKSEANLEDLGMMIEVSFQKGIGILT